MQKKSGYENIKWSLRYTLKSQKKNRRHRKRHNSKKKMQCILFETLAQGFSVFCEKFDLVFFSKFLDMSCQKHRSRVGTDWAGLDGTGTVHHGFGSYDEK